MQHFFYLARCRDGSLYAGYTINIQEREKTHNLGQGAKYTAGRRPIKIIYWESFKTQKEAMQREMQVKNWRREKKEKLVQKSLI